MPRPPAHRRKQDPYARAQLAPRLRLSKCVFADSGVRDGLDRRICSRCDFLEQHERHDLPPVSADARELDARRLGEETP